MAVDMLRASWRSTVRASSEAANARGGAVAGQEPETGVGGEGESERDAVRLRMFGGQVTGRAHGLLDGAGGPLPSPGLREAFAVHGEHHGAVGAEYRELGHAPAVQGHLARTSTFTWALCHRLAHSRTRADARVRLSAPSTTTSSGTAGGGSGSRSNGPSGPAHSTAQCRAARPWQSRRARRDLP
ncbi:hypothetical protein GCM10027168_41820 [Streptomyces capparidis]